MVTQNVPAAEPAKNNKDASSAPSTDTPGVVAPASTPPTEPVKGDAAQTLGDVGALSARLTILPVLSIFAYLGELVVLAGQFFVSLRKGVHGGDLTRQMSSVGVDTIPIALLTVGFSGAVLALYTVNTLAAYGVSDLVGGIVAVSILKETGPILSGVVLAARAGSAITAEIGSMKVTEQVDALRSMAVSPVEYLVVPRVLAGIIMLPLVCVCADAAGIFGGGVVASSMGVSVTAYLASIKQLTDPDGGDLFRGLLKTVVFGVIVALIGCREGLATEGGAAGVGQSTTRSVVLSIVLIFVANFILSFLLFNSGLV